MKKGEALRGNIEALGPDEKLQGVASARTSNLRSYMKLQCSGIPSNERTTSVSLRVVRASHYKPEFERKHGPPFHLSASAPLEGGSLSLLLSSRSLQGGSWRQGLLNRIHGIGISLACKYFYRETSKLILSLVGAAG
ncbi:hypothetical protein Syun_031844 [Stephania yunnanensis]